MGLYAVYYQHVIGGFLQTNHVHVEAKDTEDAKRIVKELMDKDPQLISKFKITQFLETIPLRILSQDTVNTYAQYLRAGN